MALNIISFNAGGMWNSIKLKATLNLCLKHKTTEYFVLFLQEIECSVLKVAQKALIDKFKLQFHFHPASDRCGGLQIAWNSDLGTTFLLQINESCQLLYLCSHNISICNIYLSGRIFEQACNHVNSALNFFSNNTEIILAGDFIPFDKNPINSSHSLRTNDIQIKLFSKITDLIRQHYLHDFAVLTDNIHSTHYDKRHKSFSRINYFFTPANCSFTSMKTHQSTISDHFMLQLIPPSTQQDRGTSHWKLNENILLPNKDLIATQTNASDHSADDISLEYEERKLFIRDLLRSLSIVKNKVEKEHKQKLTNRLLLLTQNIEFGDNSSSSFEEFQRLKNELVSIVTKEHLDNDIIFKRNWRLCNDGNPKLLKNWKDHKNSVNNISHLKIHNYLLECPFPILDSFRTYFEDIYQKKSSNNCCPLIQKFCAKHSLAKEIEIGGYITDDEVQKAINKLNRRSASGADGLTPTFYRLLNRE